MATTTSMTSATAPGVVIVGLGWGVRVQVPAFRAAGWNVVAVVGRRLEATQETAKQHEIAVASAELEQVVTRDDVQLVSIVSPPSTHLPYVQIALRAGKHVLCEKPFALNVDEARKMIQLHAEAVRATATTSSSTSAPPLGLVDHELRTLQCVKRFKALVADESVLGKVRSASARWSMGGAPQPMFNWWSERSQAGGILNALGSHWIDLLHVTLEARTEHIQCFLHALQPTKPDAATGEQRTVTADDYCTMTLMATSPHAERPERAFPIAVWIATGTMNAVDQDITVYGTKNTIVLDVRNQTVYVRTDERDPATGLTKQPTMETFSDLVDTGYQGQQGVAFPVGTVCIARLLRECVGGAGGTAALPAGLLATFEDGLRVQHVIDAAIESHDKDGARVRVKHN